MPRPKSIPWSKRVKIFVDYRKSGKVLPTARDNGVARSTVTAIVSEFEAEGFSRRPWSTLPTEMLREMQERHLKGIYGPRQSYDGGENSGIHIGPLNLGPGTDDEEGRRAAEQDPLPVSNEVYWHLRGTEAEDVIDMAREAVREYLQRDREAWLDLHKSLEEAGGLPEKDLASGTTDEPHLFPALANKLRRAFFDAEFRSQPPDDGWLQWDVAADAPSALKLGNERVAVGSEEDHDRVKKAVSSFLKAGYREQQLRFIEVERMRRELSLVGQIAQEKVGEVDESAVRHSICPECPYPEVSTDVDTAGLEEEEK